MILKSLFEIASNKYFTPSGELFFELPSTNLHILFDSNIDRKKLPDSYLQLSYDDLGFIGDDNIVDSYLCKNEYLGYREDIPEWSEPLSISNEMFFWIRHLSTIDKGIVKEYFLSTEYGDSMCDKEPYYSYKIFIDSKKIKIDDISKLIKNDYIPSKFYWSSYSSKNSTNDSVKAIVTKTKSRRLGYINLINQFFLNEKKVASSRFYTKLENHCSDILIQEELSEYAIDKGVVKNTGTGASVKPYVELAKQFGLVVSIGRTFTSGKEMQIFNTLNKEFQIPRKNQFTLTPFEKAFYLELILTKDFLYTSALFEILFIRKEITYKELRSIFYKTLLFRLRNLIKESDFSLKEKQNIQNTYNRIKGWTKPEVYLEHVLMPRLNWFFDLGFVNIDSNENKFSLSLSGIKIFQHFNVWYDLNTSFIANPDNYISSFYLNAVCEIFNFEMSGDVSTKGEIQNWIKEYVDKSFFDFKSLAPNRTTLSQALKYTKYSILLEKGVAVDSAYISETLQSELEDDYIYKFQSRYQDGYLQKKN